jgi:hypothetical protein
MAVDARTRLDGGRNGAGDRAEGSRFSGALMAVAVYPLSHLVDAFPSGCPERSRARRFARRSEPLTARTAGQEF